MPHEILSDKRYVDTINTRWNKNVLLMGDFNDDPFDKSISKFLRAKNDKEVFVELNESLEIFRNTDRDKTDKQHYLECTPIFIIACGIFLDFPITIGEIIQQTFLTSL